MKKILIILGHPRSQSFTGALVEAYANGAKRAGATVEILRIGEMSFDPILRAGYAEIQELEPDLVHFQEAITRAEHLVFVYPTWWGGPPALLRDLLERAVLPGFGFKYHKNDPFWDKLLKGKSARIITTMDAPYWYYRLVFGAPGDRMLKNAVLNFCGVRPVRFTHVSGMRAKSDAWRTNVITKIQHLGEHEGRA